IGTMPAPGDDCATWGTSSTPAIDLKRHLLYVIGASGYLHAFDLATGAEAGGYPVAIAVDRNQYEYVWAGLRIVGDRVFVGVSSYCDQPDESGVAAEGRLVAVDLDRHIVAQQWDPVPGYGNLGGIWGYGG